MPRGKSVNNQITLLQVEHFCEKLSKFIDASQVNFAFNLSF